MEEIFMFLDICQSCHGL